MKRSDWTPEMDEYIRQNYSVLSWQQMSEVLGIHWEAIKHRGLGMGLAKEKGCMANNQRDNEYMAKVQRELYG